MHQKPEVGIQQITQQEDGQMRNGIAVWAVNDGEKIYKTDLNNCKKKFNSVWDGRKAALFSGRNEVTAFQIIVENLSRDIHDMRVDMTPFRKVNGDKGCFLNGSIEIFKEHYLYIPYDKITPLCWYYAEGAKPAHAYGWVPDALIPMEVCEDISLPPNENQGFWVDVFLPGEADPGEYACEAIISADGEECNRIPVFLTVNDIILPDEGCSKNMVYVSGLEDYYGSYVGDIYDEFRKMAHDHRFEIVGLPVHTGRFDRDKLDRYYDRYMKDGNNFYSHENGYHGVGQNVGDKIFPIGMYGAHIMGRTDEELLEEAAKWQAWFAEKDWDGAYFWYILDEPRSDKYQWIRDRSALLKSHGIDIPVFTTSSYKEELDGAIDIWCAGQGFDVEDMKKHPKDKFWFYNGYAPKTPLILLEGSAVELRANQWLMARYNVELWFLWESTHWKHNMQGPRARTYQNVYSYPVTFLINHEDESEFVMSNGGPKFGNGDGTLFYPGMDPHYPEHDLKYPGPISSIRMKNLRRGAQDLEYIRLAKEAGFEKEADEIVRRAIPRALSEVDKTENSTWSVRGSDWDGYRRELADLLIKK
jgi:hypothetical protein